MAKREPRSLRLGRLALLAMLAACLLAPPSSADQAEQLEELEHKLAASRDRSQTLSREAQALRDELLALRAESISVARKAQEQETRLSAVEAKLADLQAREADMSDQLAARHGELVGTLGALQRIALRPPEALFAAPGLPIDTARSALLLSHAVPEVERRVEGLRDELEALRNLRVKIQEEQEALAIASRGLEAERDRLNGLIERKRMLREKAAREEKAARARAEHLAAEAKDLRDLIERLEREAQERAEREAREKAKRAARERAERLAREKAEREAAERQARADDELQAEIDAARAARQQAQRERALKQTLGATQREGQEAAQAAPSESGPSMAALEKPATLRPFPVSPNTAGLTMPARGELVTRYGQANGGLSSKGIGIATRIAARVVAPYDGQVAYAGRFRGYGQILIIEHGGRYHTLLAGLDRVDAVVGQWVLAGEPVGVMGGTAKSRPELYLELRRSGQPINPLPWLATTSDKVQG